MTELTSLTISQALELLRAGEISALGIDPRAPGADRSADPDIGAYLTVTAEQVLGQAQAADQALDERAGHVA